MTDVIGSTEASERCSSPPRLIWSPPIAAGKHVSIGWSMPRAARHSKTRREVDHSGDRGFVPEFSPIQWVDVTVTGTSPSAPSVYPFAARHDTPGRTCPPVFVCKTSSDASRHLQDWPKGPDAPEKPVRGYQTHETQSDITMPFVALRSPLLLSAVGVSERVWRGSSFFFLRPSRPLVDDWPTRYSML